MALPNGLVEFADSELERKADELFRRRPDVELEAPVNLEVLVQNTENVELIFEMGFREKYSVEGCVCKRPLSRTLTVIIDCSVMSGTWPEYNAVLGEEFAHIHLHQAIVHDIKTVDDFIEIQNDPQWVRFERDARRFSEAIRMPSSLISMHAERFYVRAVDEHGFGDAYKIEKTMRTLLSEKFKVPLKDMHKRMNDWPCLLRSRIFNSVQTATSILLPYDWTVEAVSPHRQQALFDDLFPKSQGMDAGG